MQKLFELQKGAQLYLVNFAAENSQFDWLEILVVYRKSDQHKIINNISNAKVAAKLLGKVKIENFPNTYNVSNDL